MDVDLRWRPDSYLVPTDATEMMLMGVRSTLRRERIRDLLVRGRMDEALLLRSLEERTRDSLPDFAERDPLAMSGEHLPELEAGEVEIARIDFFNLTLDVVCVRVRPHAGGWTVFVVDERGRRLAVRRPWYRHPLRFGQLVECIETARHERESCLPQPGPRGLVRGLLLDDVVRFGSFAAAFGNLESPLVRVSSAFYPGLGPYFARVLHGYLNGPEFGEVLEALDATREARPRPEEFVTRVLESRSGDIVRYGRIDPLRAKRAFDHLVRGGEESRVLGELCSYDERFADSPDLRAELALRVGVLCEQASAFGLAVRVYERGREADPQDRSWRYWLHNNTAYCLVQLGEYPLARRQAALAIRTWPERHNAWKNRGLALAGMGRPAPAARMLIRATRLCPQDVRALAHLEDLVAEQGHAWLEDAPDVLAFLEQCLPQPSGEGPSG